MGYNIINLVVFVSVGLSCVVMGTTTAYDVVDGNNVNYLLKKQQVRMTSSYYNYNYNYYSSKRECNEIYQVREGETLHSISDKCDDPFILENNPHIQQHDDVFPGLVIKITRK